MSQRPYQGKKSAASTAVMVILIVILLLAAALVALLYLREKADALPTIGGTDLPPSTSAPVVDPPSPSVPADASPSVPPDSSPSPSGPEELPWYLTLVNPTHSLPEDFDIETEPIYNTLSFDARAVEDLREMLAACEAAGLQPLVCSAFRPQGTQEKLFQNKVNEFRALGYAEDDAIEAAGKIVAVPGTSEHQLGLAADIVDASHQVLDKSQESTAVQKWLMEHCWEYGFILRYPNDKSEITDIIYEPWHYRYVGKEDAKAITDSGLCLEEYLAQEFGVE